MCIIVIKEKGVDLPKDYIFKNCFHNNSDGAGFMYNKDGKVIIQKGYMTYEAFDSALKKALKKIKDVKNTGMVFHFRITTQGGTNPQNCHPFPMSADENDLQATYIKTPLGIAHNGIIELTSGYYSSYYYGSKAKKDDHLSDTQIFIRDYLSHIYALNPYFYLESNGLDLVSALIDSKMCFLDGEGEITTVGSFIEEKKVLYSNSTYSYQKTYLPYVKFTESKTSKSKTSKSKSPYLWGRYNDYDDYDDYGYDYDCDRYSTSSDGIQRHVNIMPIEKDVYSDSIGFMYAGDYGIDSYGRIYLIDKDAKVAFLYSENEDGYIYDASDITKEIHFDFSEASFYEVQEFDS